MRSAGVRSTGMRSAGMRSAGKVEPTHETGRETERELGPALAGGCACVELVEMTRWWPSANDVSGGSSRKLAAGAPGRATCRG
jgi:hypothetical protein